MPFDPKKVWKDIGRFDEYTDALFRCGCCPSPYCEYPIFEFESKQTSVNACGGTIEDWIPSVDTDDVPCADAGRYYRTLIATYTYTYHDEGDPIHFNFFSNDETETRSYTRSYEFKNHANWGQGSWDCNEHGRVCSNQFLDLAASIVESRVVTGSGGYNRTTEGSGEVSGQDTGVCADYTITQTTINPPLPVDVVESTSSICTSGSPLGGDYEWTVSGSTLSGSFSDSGSYAIGWNWTETGSATVTLTDPVTISDLENEADVRLGRMSCFQGSKDFAERIVDFHQCGDPLEDVEDSPQGLDEVRMRYRVIVPEYHPGSFYRVEWDEVFFPEGWDEEGGTAPTMTPKVWEWTGGDRQSPWSSEVSVPSGGRGYVEVCNVRVKCYNAPWEVPPLYDDYFTTYTPDE